MQACAVCGEQRQIPLYQGLLSCQVCGFVWADLSLTEEESQQIYGRDYFFGAEYVDYLSEERILKFGFRRVLKRLSRLLKPAPDHTPPRLLEIGSAYGFFLDVARPDFDVTGVEFNSVAAEYARAKGHNVICGDFLGADLGDRKFDSVVCLATLEHLPGPDRYIEKAVRHLIPGGVFYCTTVNIDSWLARLCGSHWRMIHPPTHLSYFSARTLCRLAERFDLRVLDCSAVWQYRALDVALHPILAQNRGHRLYQMLKKLGITQFPLPFNFGDVIALTAIQEGHEKPQK